MKYLQKRILAFGFAINGFLVFLKEDAHAIIHFLMAIVVILGGIFFEIEYLEWLACLVCIALVITAEMFNSAIENLTNLVSPDKNLIAGKVKDISAGAVLVSSFISAIVGLIVFGEKFLIFVKNSFGFI